MLILHRSQGLYMWSIVEMILLTRALVFGTARIFSRHLTRTDLNRNQIRDQALRPWIQKHLLRTADTEELIALAENPWLIRRTIVALSEHPEYSVRLALLPPGRHTYLPHSVLDRLVRDPEVTVRRRAALKGLLTPSMRHRAAQDPDPFVGQFLVKNGTRPDWLNRIYLQSALAHGEKTTRHAIHITNTVEELTPEFLDQAPIPYLWDYLYTHEYLLERIRHQYPDMADAMVPGFYGNMLELEELCRSLAD